MTFRFDLGNRDLTEDEVEAVNIAKQSFLKSFEKHGGSIRPELLLMMQTPSIFKPKEKINDAT